MSGPFLITQRMVELRFGAKVIRDLFDKDRSGQADPERIEMALGEASDVVWGLLRKGFPSEAQIRDLVDNDKAVQGYCCQIFMGVAGQMKPGLLNAQGKNPYIEIQDRAEKKLAEVATAAKRRAKGEEQAGNNRRTGVSTNRNTSQRAIFQATSDDPEGPGGF
jgi:phage gp36-like protein